MPAYSLKRVAHFGGNGWITHQTPQHRERGVQRVQAGAHLHLFDLVYGVAVGKIDARRFERRPAIRKVVFDHEVLRLLGVHEGGGIGALFGYDDVRILKAAFAQHLGDLGIGAGSDLVDHRPREGHAAFVLHIRKAFAGDATLFRPRLHDRQNRVPQLFAVVRTVVHGYKRERRGVLLKARLEERSDLPHDGDGRIGRGFDIGLYGGEGIALFRDGEGDHLQRFGDEQILKQRFIRRVRPVAAQGERYGRDHGFFDRSVALERHRDGEVVKRAIRPVDDVPVKAFTRDDAAVRKPLVQYALHRSGGKRAKEVARTEMNPLRFGEGIFRDLFQIEGGKRESSRSPLCRIPKRCFFEKHGASPSFLAFSPII